MTDYEPITTELREAVKRAETIDGTPMVTCGADEFERLCDNIDAIHAGLERELEGSVKLPLDADGVPIRVWDEVEQTDDSGKHGVVMGIRLTFNGWLVIFCGTVHFPENLRHHHDTWERIIEDLLDENISGVEAVARCKALAKEES